MIADLAALVPEQAYEVFDICVTRFRIHPMWADHGNRGAHFESRWDRDESRRLVWLRHDGFRIYWAMRPAGVARGGHVAVSASWDFMKKGWWRFWGWNTSLNYPGHTSQNGPRDMQSTLREYRDKRTPDERYVSLLAQLPDAITDLFMSFECNGSSCSHRDPTLRDGDVVEPGLTGGVTELFARVW